MGWGLRPGAWINRALRPFDLSLVRASKLEFQYGLATEEGREEPPLPDGAADILHHDNHRLLFLRNAYRDLKDHPATAPSLWTEEFSRKVDLKKFRSDNAYLWQGARTPLQQMMWILVGYYVHYIDHMKLLDRLDEDGLFGA